jgi:hypothetical protein
MRGRSKVGPLNPAWRGGRHRDADDYVLVWKPEHPEANNKGCVREHRLVMEKKLGRALARKEVVHHVNGVRCDNRPENLELFSSNGEHLRHELTGTKRGPSPLRGRKLGSDGRLLPGTKPQTPA